jgi:hypothetical protein
MFWETVANACPAIASFPHAGADVLASALAYRTRGPDRRTETTRAHDCPDSAQFATGAASAEQPKSRSDSEKLSLISRRGFGCDLSEKPLTNLAKASDFQAEYEGSIPFTRSNDFNCLDEMGILVATKRAESLNQTFRDQFMRYGLAAQA